MTLTYYKKPIKTVISIEEYLQKIEKMKEHDRYEKYLKNDQALFNGMLKWDKKDFPEGWGGPYPLNYVHVTITKYNTTRTEAEYFQDAKKYEYRTKFNYSNELLNRVGFDDKYFVRPFVDASGISYPDRLCSYSQLTDEEIEILNDTETPNEKVFRERSIFKQLSSEDWNPKNTYTIEHPYQLRLSGNDDCSYSYFYNADEGELLNMDANLVLSIASWMIVKDICHFSN